MPDTSLGFTYTDGTSSSSIWLGDENLAKDINDYLAAQQTEYDSERTTDAAANPALFAGLSPNLPRAGLLVIVAMFRWQSNAAANLFMAITRNSVTVVQTSFAGHPAQATDQFHTMVGLVPGTAGVNTLEATMSGTAGLITARGGSRITAYLL